MNAIEICYRNAHLNNWRGKSTDPSAETSVLLHTVMELSEQEGGGVPQRVGSCGGRNTRSWQPLKKEERKRRNTKRD